MLWFMLCPMQGAQGNARWACWSQHASVSLMRPGGMGMHCHIDVYTRSAAHSGPFVACVFIAHHKAHSLESIFTRLLLGLVTSLFMLINTLHTLLCILPPLPACSLHTWRVWRVGWPLSPRTCGRITWPQHAWRHAAADSRKRASQHSKSQQQWWPAAGGTAWAMPVFLTCCYNVRLGESDGLL